MRFYDSLDAVPAGFGPSAVTIGKFDGVHAGHRRVITELRDVADAAGLTATVVTFDRNPMSLIRPDDCPDALLSNAQKVELLAEVGVDATLMLSFDRQFSAQSPEEFVRRILVEALHARVVLVGLDFRFGAQGAGSVSRLRELGAIHGFDVRLVDEVRPRDDRRTSSTWIRELLTEGRVGEAAELLGHLPTIRSVVVRGAQRGREFGYPTANLSPAIEGFIPADGVYAAWLGVDGTRYPAAVSIGNNPTFDGVPDKQVEAHALDQVFELYGKSVEVSFIGYIRPMLKFDDVDSLIAQMKDDESRVREIFARL